MPPICGIAKVLTAMSEDDVKALLALLAAPISAKAVSRELQAAKYQVSYQTVYRHRAETCSC
jgi:Fe2+ or Zn2+ uptake regulation protein